MNKLLITATIVLVLSLSACSKQKTTEQLLLSADRYSEKRQFTNAIIDYKNAVRQSPQSADARLGLGRAYLNRGNYISAEKELDKAMELGSKNSKVIPLLAHAKARLNKASDVEELLESTVDLDDSDYLVVLTFAGISVLADGQITKAQDYFSQGSAIKPDDKFSQLASAYLLYTEGKMLEALTTINTLLAKNETFDEAIRLQANLYLLSKEYEQASQSFTHYIGLYPEDYNIQFFQVNTLIKAEKFNEANVLNNNLLKYFKNSALALQFKAQLEYQGNNFTEAKQYATEAISYNEANVVAKMIAGVSSYKLNELEQSYGYLVGLEETLPADHPINVILLSIKIKLGYTDDLSTSIIRLKALKNEGSNTDLLQLTSAELMNIGDFANAQVLINKAAIVSPQNPQIKMQQGALLLSQGDLSGIKSVEEALVLDPSMHEAEFALANQYMQGNEITKAKGIAEKWLASEQYKISGNLLSGMISLQEEKELEAQAYFNKTLILDKDNVSALYGLASVYGYKKQIPQAIVAYEKVLALNPNHYQAIFRYNALQAEQNDTAAANSYLNSLYEQSRLNGQIHKNLVIGIALNLIRGHQYLDAIELLESIKEESNLPAKYWSTLSNTYALNKQYDKAASSLKEGVEVNTNNYALRVAYISALTRIKKLSEALKMARITNKYFPDDEDLMTTLAYLELVNNNVAAAKQQLKAIVKHGHTNDLSDQLMAKVAMKEKDYEKAISLYRAMYKKESSGVNIINLSRSLQFSMQSAQAEQVIEEYLKENNADNQVRMLLAELYQKNNSDGDKSAQIINTYKDAVIVQPENIVALNNLAWQEYLNNDLSNAQKHIEKAIDIAPDSLVLQESYGVILVANEQFSQAIKILTAIQQKGSVDVTSKVALAEAFIATNQYENANALLTGLSAHNSQVNQKIIQLQRLVSTGKSKVE